MLTDLPRLPGSEPLDRRVLALFVGATLLLAAPSVAPLARPVGEEGMRDNLSALTSDVREALTLVDHRGTLPAPYYVAELETLADDAETRRNGLLHHAFDPAAADLRSRYLDAAAGFAALVDDLTTTENDAAVEDLRGEVQRLADALESALEGRQ